MSYYCGISVLLLRTLLLLSPFAGPVYPTPTSAEATPHTVRTQTDRVSFQ